MHSRKPELGLSRPGVRLTLAAASLIMLAGCASIPLGTLWKMRSFDADDLARIDAREIRLAGRIDPAPQRVDPSRTHLELSLVPRVEGAPDEHYAFSLRVSDDYEPALIPEPDPQHRWVVLELDDAGLAAWQRLQPKLVNVKKNYRGASFSFEFKATDEGSEKFDAIWVSARLELDPQQGPLTLLDRKRFKVEQEPEPAPDNT